MKKTKKITLSLDEETNRILNISSENNKINKSKLIRYLILHFNQAPFKLRRVLIEAEKDIQRRKNQKIWMDKIHDDIKGQINEETLRKYGWIK